MADADEIAATLKRQGLTLVGDVVDDKEGQGHLVFVLISFDESGKQNPTNFKISKAEKIVELIFGNLSIILVNDGGIDVKTSIKSMIMRKYSNLIRNTFVSVENKNVSLWIEPKAALTAAQNNEIESSVKKIVGLFGLSFDHFTNTREGNTPSKTACLNVIRRKSPLLQDQLESELNERGFDVPSQEWLAKNLDRWRKGELIHRKIDGCYVMTVRGLKALGSAKGRRSPDIVRALDMARRQR